MKVEALKSAHILQQLRNYNNLDIINFSNFPLYSFLFYFDL